MQYTLVPSYAGPFYFFICGFFSYNLDSRTLGEMRNRTLGDWRGLHNLGLSSEDRNKRAPCPHCAAFKAEPSEQFWLLFLEISLRTTVLHTFSCPTIAIVLWKMRSPGTSLHFPEPWRGARPVLKGRALSFVSFHMEPRPAPGSHRIWLEVTGYGYLCTSHRI